MTNNNTAKVTITFSADNSEVSYDFNDAAIKRFGKGAGHRLNLGTVYFLANKEDRARWIECWGRGAVRRGLMVLAKGRNTNEKDAKAALALAESLRTAQATTAAAA
jgi:hypothetical protein